MNRFLLRLYAIALICLSAISCADDKFRMPDVSGDGEADILVTATFKSYDPALDESRTEGNKLDGIDHLSVLVYDATGEKLIIHKDYGKDELSVVKDNTDKPNDAVDPDLTVATNKVSFKLPALRYGRYKIYVVANADLTGRDVNTEAKLRAQRFEWSTTVADNAQMFGWFSNSNAPEINASGLEAPQVVINRPAMNINAWLVRLASKVTVAYDASGLNPGVTIYLKSVTIKDIPASCALGERNTPTAKDQLIVDGEVIKYYTGEDPTEASFTDSWPSRLTNKENIVFGNPEHTHDANALFFYENMQGTGKNKAQDADKNGEIDFPNPDENDPKNESGFKDNKPYGTYVEVEAYYTYTETGVDTDPKYPTTDKRKGRIVYRFMLGKNIKDNYDAERNYHYKLTLKFNKWANDYDWHIDYTPDPEIKLPNPYFISYLYDKSAVIPVEITGEIEPGSELEANITENGWWPVSYNEETGKIEKAPASQYYTKAVDEKKVWNGFLSLRNTGGTVSIGENIYNASAANTENERYWNENQRGFRNYNTVPGEYIDAANGTYTVEKSKDNPNTTIFNIPYYTRAKNLVKASGYTGNNPYVSYQRKAVVHFTAKIKSPTQGKYITYEKDVNIVQVRRVVNPKGIWRAHDEDGNFLVHLMRLETEYTVDPYTSTGQFQSFNSIGPWYAEVMAGGVYQNGTHTDDISWIKLSPESGASTIDPNNPNRIVGENGTPIKFNYSPNGTCNADVVRYGIIKVRYHNYTCEHLIFVRQGYAPIAVKNDPKATVWHTFNLVTGTEMASSPCDEGSLFKRFALDQPIRAINNITYPFKEQITFDDVLWGPSSNKMLVVNYELPGGTKYGDRAWIAWGAPKDKSAFDEITLESEATNVPKGTKMKVASVNDYVELYEDGDILNGYGVLYDGLADGVQAPVKDAYSYYAPYDGKGESVGANGKGRGMRGCFVYNIKTGAQIFLPIGAAGYGRRKQKNFNASPGDGFSPGMLIYANRSSEIEDAMNLPLLFDLYRRPGANYWANESQPGYLFNNRDTQNSIGWDFNYITFDFFPLSPYSVISDQEYRGQIATDALRIRCVVPGTSKPVTPAEELTPTKKKTKK